MFQIRGSLSQGQLGILKPEQAQVNVPADTYRVTSIQPLSGPSGFPDFLPALIHQKIYRLRFGLDIEVGKECHTVR